MALLLNVEFKMVSESHDADICSLFVGDLVTILLSHQNSPLNKFTL